MNLYGRLTTAFLAALLAAAPCAHGQAETDSVDRDYSAELPRIPAVEPADTAATFEIHPRFDMELAAAEPLVHDPVAMAFDEFGRLFVVEMRGYSESREDHSGTVRMLTDTDDDGVYDESVVYADGLDWPVAVACWDGGVFVGVPPNVLYCKDADGDGKAEIRETVYTGFSIDNVQGLMNSFNWGLDNRYYASASANGGEIRPGNDPAALPIGLRGRDFSFDPRTMALRPESGGAQHGLSFDDWGRRFVCHNSDHCQLILFDDRYIARNPYLASPASKMNIAEDGAAADVYRISPVEPWRIVRTRLRMKGIVPGIVEGGGRDAGYFTSATGVTVYKGDAWPAEYRGNVFIGDVGSNLIHRKILSPDGVRLRARRADPNTEFVRSTDIWFRPVQYANGPDGNLYAADMYREVIEHPASLPPVIKKHLDLTSGSDRGRIYRIAAKGAERRPTPRLGDMASAELVPLLAHDNAWHRETASRLLYTRQDASVADALRAMVRDSANPLGRMHALYALAGLNALDAETVNSAMKDGHAGVREHGARAAENLVAEDDAVLAAMTALARDPDPRVRYQTAFSIGYATGDARTEALAAIAKQDLAEPLVRTALLSSAYIGAADLALVLMGDGDFAKANESFLADLAVQAGAAGDAEGIAALVARIDAMGEADASLAQALVRGAISGLRIGGVTGPAAEALAASTTASGLLETMLVDAYAKAADAGAEVDARRDAALLLAFDDFAASRAVLATLLAGGQPAELQTAALQVLRRYDDPEAAAMTLEALPQFGPAARGQAVEALFSRTAWTSALLDAIEAGSFNPATLDSVRTQALRNHPDAALRARAETLLAAHSPRRREEVVDQYQSVLAMEGDAARGRTIFETNCAQCHRIGETGFAVGPDLTTMTNSGPDKILVNILDPNREVNPQYINYTIDTLDFETLSGIIASESATSVTLKRANGAADTILRVNIESIRSENLSIMPEGWEETIDPQAMADLIAFLTTLQ